MLDSVEIVKKNNPDFELHIVGSGPKADSVKEFSENNRWCTYHESLYGDKRDTLLLESSAILMPGLVGLVAVDSFHFACPIISTDCGQHSPEFAYLINGENSLIYPAEGTAIEYANLISEYIQNDSIQAKIRQGARDSASVYTIDDTAQRFVDGIESLFV